MLIFYQQENGESVSAPKQSLLLHDELYNGTCRIRSLHLFDDSRIVVGTWERGERSAKKQLNYLLKADRSNTCLLVIVMWLGLCSGGQSLMGNLAPQWSTVVNKMKLKAMKKYFLSSCKPDWLVPRAFEAG